MIRTLTERDRLPNGRNLFELTLSYAFKQPKKASVKFSSGVQGNLYDSAFAMLGQIVDNRGRLYHFAECGKHFRLSLSRAFTAVQCLPKGRRAGEGRIHLSIAARP